MNEVSKEFIECLFSANKFTDKDGKELCYVSIRESGGAHEICGTDGMALALYTIKEDINWLINGFADLRHIKMSKNAKVTSGYTTQLNGTQGIVVNMLNGKKPEHTFIPVVQDINFPRYSEITKFNTHSFNGLCDSFYAEYPVDANKMFETIDSINLKRIELISVKADLENTSLNIGIHDKATTKKIGTLNLELAPDKKQIEGVPTVYFNPELMYLVTNEAANMCKSNVSLFIKNKLGPAHIKGFSDGSSRPDKRQNIYAQYIIMPMNRA